MEERFLETQKTLEQQVSSLKQKYQEAKTRLKQCTENLAAQETQLAKVSSELRVREAELEQKEVALGDRAKLVEELGQVSAGLKDELAEARNLLEDRAREFEGLAKKCQIDREIHEEKK